MKKNHRVTWLDYGLWRQSTLRPFLHGSVKPDFGRIGQHQVRVGWGRKPSGQRAQKIAQKGQSEQCLLEDGFLRSIGLGIEGHPPLAMVVDSLGIYYDATEPSSLEQLIQSPEALTPLYEDAQAAWDLIVAYGLSKYNQAPDEWPQSVDFDRQQTNVLVIDQTVGDLALQYGGATAETFQAMFEAARAEHPNAVIWVKTHPDVLSGKKQGYLTAMLQQPGVRLLTASVSPMTVLKRMDCVYTVTSHMGFEALLQGKPVVTFGLPWYAGWGVSDDRHQSVDRLKISGRRGEASVLTLFTAAYLSYSRYLNPYTGEAGTIFDVIDYLHQMKQKNQLLQGTVWCVGLSWWKRCVLKPFLRSANGRLVFLAGLTDCEAQVQTERAQYVKVLVWGQKHADIQRWAMTQGLPLLRMEDGFIRSVGLGSNLVPPLSLVIDDLGIYFDATQPSRLEALLQNTVFSPSLLHKAQVLSEALIRLNVGKYNVGNGGLKLPTPRPQKVILVPGQVENDASIAYGSPKIKQNLALLQQVRALYPDAYIIFKPHPDVVSGNRPGVLAAAAVLAVANQMVLDADILSCIVAVDEVHTMTSLTGFEALIRGKKVVCYGAPFYAGWGLTTDYVTMPRRTRQLTLTELVAATLLLYPTYVHPKTGQPIDAFTALGVLVQQKKEGKQARTQQPWAYKKLRQAQRLLSILWRNH